jgi:hypothetical protein
MNNYPKNWPEGVALTLQGEQSCKLISIIGVDLTGRIYSQCNNPALHPMFIVEPVSTYHFITDGEMAWAYAYISRSAQTACVLTSIYDKYKSYTYLPIPSEEAVRNAIMLEINE